MGQLQKLNIRIHLIHISFFYYISQSYDVTCEKKDACQKTRSKAQDVIYQTCMKKAAPLYTQSARQSITCCHYAIAPMQCEAVNVEQHMPYKYSENINCKK
jgi:hypothetical protein